MVSSPNSPIVIDTNVILAGAFSTTGAAYRLLHLTGRGHFDIAISVPLILEYEEILRNHQAVHQLSNQQMSGLLDYYCEIGIRCVAKFKWRGFLPDRDDELLLDLAVAARAPFIVTHNLRHFANSESFAIRAVTPIEYLRIAELLP